MDETPDIPPEPGSGKSDLLPRLLSGIVMVIVALGALYLGGYAWAALVVLGSCLMCFEWQSITKAVDGTPLIGAALAAAVSGCLVILWMAGAKIGLLAIAIVALGVAIVHLLQPLGGWLWMALGIVYIAVPAASLIWLRAQEVPNGIILIAFLFTAVWATDIGAYFVGRSVGGPKIFPSISPKKTWSGAIGGAIIAAIFVMLLKPALGLEGSYFAIAVAGLFMSAVCQIGDAFESAVKRQFDVKDSGSIIPGHGGILDRVDGLLFCAPVLAAIIWMSTI